MHSNTDLRSDPKTYTSRTERTPAGRWGHPADFAGPAVFLCSAASQFITGEIMVVDGVSIFPGPPQFMRSSCSCPKIQMH